MADLLSPQPMIQPVNASAEEGQSQQNRHDTIWTDVHVLLLERDVVVSQRRWPIVETLLWVSRSRVVLLPLTLVVSRIEADPDFVGVRKHDARIQLDADSVLVVSPRHPNLVVHPWPFFGLHTEVVVRPLRHGWPPS
jgi:hypothetical protein